MVFGFPKQSHIIRSMGFRLPIRLLLFFQAMSIALFNPPEFLTNNLIPPLVACFTLPSFYLLVKQITSNKAEILCSFTVFALLPNAFFDQIEGAGLAESFGLLFLIWFAYFLLRVYKQPSFLNSILAGFLMGLCVLSSPGSAIAAPYSSAIFTLFLLRKMYLQKLFSFLWLLIIIGITGMLVASPYLLQVLTNHGRGIFIAPVLAQFQRSGQSPSFLISAIQRLLVFNFASGKFAFAANMLILIGLIDSLTGPAYFLALFFLLNFIPSEGGWLGAPVLSILAGKAVVNVMLPFIENKMLSLSQAFRQSGKAFIMIAFLSAGLVNAIDGLTYLVHDKGWLITGEEIAELREYRNIIPTDAKVVVYANSAFKETSPFILQREVINSPFGLEWQPGEAEKAKYINDELRDAVTLDDILLAGRHFNLSGFYLVTPKQVGSLLSSMPKSPTLQAKYLINANTIEIIHIFKE